MQDREEHFYRIQNSLDTLYGTENITNNRSKVLKDQHRPCYPKWFYPRLPVSYTPFDSLSQEENLQSASSHTEWALQPVIPWYHAASKLRLRDSLYKHHYMNTGVKILPRSEQI